MYEENNRRCVPGDCLAYLPVAVSSILFFTFLAAKTMDDLFFWPPLSLSQRKRTHSVVQPNLIGLPYYIKSASCKVGFIWNNDAVLLAGTIPGTVY